MKLFAVILTIMFCCNSAVADDEDIIIKGMGTGGKHLIPTDENKQESEDKENQTPELYKDIEGLSAKTKPIIVSRMNEDNSCNIFTIIEVSCSYQKTSYIISSIFFLIFIIVIIVIFRKKRWLATILCNKKHKK
ncbi:MAG: hypothetical protein QM487_02460 [Candidatus Marithrix sp.]